MQYYCKAFVSEICVTFAKIRLSTCPKRLIRIWQRKEIERKKSNLLHFTRDEDKLENGVNFSAIAGVSGAVLDGEEKLLLLWTNGLWTLCDEIFVLVWYASNSSSIYWIAPSKFAARNLCFSGAYWDYNEKQREEKNSAVSRFFYPLVIFWIKTCRWLCLYGIENSSIQKKYYWMTWL